MSGITELDRIFVRRFTHDSYWLICWNVPWWLSAVASSPCQAQCSRARAPQTRAAWTWRDRCPGSCSSSSRLQSGSLWRPSDLCHVIQTSQVFSSRQPPTNSSTVLWGHVTVTRSVEQVILTVGLLRAAGRGCEWVARPTWAWRQSRWAASWNVKPLNSSSPRPLLSNKYPYNSIQSTRNWSVTRPGYYSVSSVPVSSCKRPPFCISPLPTLPNSS